MDIRFHFDRPVSQLELRVEDNSLCILSGLGKLLKKIRLHNNGRRILLKANSSICRTTSRENIGGFNATYCTKLDLTTFESLNLEARKKYLLNWCIDNVEAAMNSFLSDGLTSEVALILHTFRDTCNFSSQFNGKWNQIDNQRARVVIFQKFEKADVHIESKIYRSRTSQLSPILVQTRPSVFIFQKHLKPPILTAKGDWGLAE